MIRTHARLRTLPAFVSLFTLLTVAPALTAQRRPVDFTLDPATTAIHWTLNTTVHTVHGTFKLKNGTVRVDPATGDASGLIVIDAASGESGDGARDKRMDNVVLETSKYPIITFRPTHVGGKVDLSAPGPVTVDGVMNLHGQDHPMQLAVDLQPRDSGVASKIHFDVPYVAWGMKDPSVMILRVDKKVAIDVDATATPAADVAHLRQ
jgi:polyisoprenoid-binding protein YceI